jgi:hypothetical protein
MPRARQARLVSATLLQAAVILLVVNLPDAQFASSACAAGTTRLMVMARVATFFRMQVEHQESALRITALDIERGYIIVPAASSFSVITNAQDGLIVDFRPRSDVFRSVVVTGLQGPVELGPQGGSAIHNAPHGRTTLHQLGYRFTLRPGLRPGDYPWPLEISVRSA